MKTNKRNKIKSSIAFLVFMLCIFGFNASVFAGEAKDVRQINVNLPEVTAEVEGTYSLDDITEFKLDNEALEIKSAYKAADAESKLVYVLIDISSSMSQPAFNALKPELIKYITSFGKKDKVIVMTFGKTVETVLKGGEKKSKVKSVINSIKCNSSGTTFYKALTKAMKSSVDKNYVRKYAVVVSDGADFEKGNSSQEEVLDLFKTNRLPVYGLCLASTATSSANGFGYIARESGGELVKFSASNASAQFSKLKKITNNVTVIEAESKKKRSDGEKQLLINLKSGGKTYTAEDLATVNAKADDTKPSVDSIEYDKDANCFNIKYSENIENGDNKASYLITKNDKELSIVSVKYNSDSYVASVYMNDKVYSGSYKFKLSGINDMSDNKNPLETSELTQDIDGYSVIFKILKIVGICLIPILFLLALYLILLNIKKKKNVEKIKDIFVEQVEEKEHEQIVIQQPKGMAIKLSVDAGNGTFHTVDYNLISSMIVGRSTTSDLVVEDEIMSRQHFVIEQVENGLAVTDLDTTNGTYVNGVPIKSRTFISSGDRISAGNSVITVIY